MNNHFSDIVMVSVFVSRMIGITEWSIVFFILMEVVICKDARHVNTSKILSRTIGVRIRMFKRSFKDLFYKASVIIFVCSIFAIFSMLGDMWNGRLPRSPYTWTIVSVFLPLGIALLYIDLGYQLTLFKKFKLFMKNEHE